MMNSNSWAMDGSLQNLKGIEKINHIRFKGIIDSCSCFFFLPDAAAIIAIYCHAQRCRFFADQTKCLSYRLLANQFLCACVYQHFCFDRRLNTVQYIFTKEAKKSSPPYGISLCSACCFHNGSCSFYDGMAC